MKRTLPRLFAFACALLTAGSLLVGCESQFEAPAEMTLQTKSAVEVLPSDARFVGMVDLQAMQQNEAANPFGDGHFAFDDLSGETGARIQDFLDATGFDPQKDVKEVYVAASDMGRDGHPSLVAYATFDRERFQAYVEQQWSDDFESTDYMGVTIYQSRKNDHHLSFALATDNMIVASPEVESVQAMLDRLAGQGASLKDDAETMSLIALASGSSSAWFVARDVGEHVSHTRTSDDAIEREMDQIGRAVRDVAFAFNVRSDGAEGTLFMHPREGVSSSDIADLTKGVVAAMKASPDITDDALKMLDRVRVRSQGEQVRVNFFVDNATLGASR
ncbi:MAG: hypothetical protein ACE5G0_14420 [Rhodothermales bacterium]